MRNFVCRFSCNFRYSGSRYALSPTLSGGPVVWAWDFHVGGLKFETLLPAKARGLPSGLSSSHQTCLVPISSPVLFAF
uniref:Putative ovule protein n=1 Tax=Solanum chacoense TaxID=4108 RepID=A0A0V0I3S2_SOLCH